MPLSSLGKGYKGGRQQRCNVCNRKTSWVCAVCTQGTHALWPCCPEITRKRGNGRGPAVKHNDCLARHRTDPDWIPRVKTRKAKRARAQAHEEPEDDAGASDGEELFGEEGGCNSCDEDDF